MQKVLFAQCPAKDVHLIMRHAKAFRQTESGEMYHGRKWSGITPEKFMQQVDTYIRWYNERRIKLSPGAVRKPQNVPPTMRAGMIKQSSEIVHPKEQSNIVALTTGSWKSGEAPVTGKNVVYVITETEKKRRCKSGGERCISGY